MTAHHVERLLAIAGDAFAPVPPRRPAFLVGPRGDELWALLRRRNGFYAFEGALHVFAANTIGAQSLERWNARDHWRDRYGDLTDGCVFFAEDVFGGQFALVGNAVFAFDAETGTVEHLADDLDRWARRLLGDFEALTGQGLAHAWQRQYGPLPAGKRLVPAMPFVVGGDFQLSNLRAVDAVGGMRLRGELAVRLRDLADGRSVEPRAVDEQRR